MSALSSPAQAKTAVGATPAHFAVSDTGAARYRVPIQVPPGIGGMHPSLSLSYSSRGGDGLAGWGWSLSGISAIQRCTGSHAETDEIHAITYTNRDFLCLNGIPMRKVAGAYGHGGAVYRLAQESFSRITQHGNGINIRFEVEYKNGHVAWYGKADGARQLDDSGTGIRTWYIARLEDQAGNAVIYRYKQDPGGAIVPDEIRYTETAGGAAFYTIKFHYENRPAGEAVPAWRAGVKVGRKLRLRNLDVVYNSASQLVKRYKLNYENSLSPVMRHSRLASITECGLGGNACFKPITIAWQDKTSRTSASTPGSSRSSIWLDLNGDGQDDEVSWQTWRWSPPGGRGGNRRDTEPDIHWIEYKVMPPSGKAYPDATPTAIKWTRYAARTARVVDIDGDGKQEILTLRRLYKDGHTLGEVTMLKWAGGKLKALRVNLPVKDVYYQDFNGDGYVDYVYVNHDDTLEFYLNQRDAADPYPSSPSITHGFFGNYVVMRYGDTRRCKTTQGFRGTHHRDYRRRKDPRDPRGPRTPPPQRSGSCKGPAYNAPSQFDHSDFDGDGRADLLIIGDGNNGSRQPEWHVVYSRIRKGCQANDSCFVSKRLPGMAGDYWYLATLDLNADGLTDLAYYDRQTRDWYTRLSTGDGFAPEKSAGSEFVAGSKVKRDEVIRQTRAMDVNHDGLQDLVFAVPYKLEDNGPRRPDYDYRWRVKYSTGAGLSKQSQPIDSLLDGADINTNMPDYLPTVLRSVDMDGDGVHEIILQTKVNWAGQAHTRLPAPDRVIGITNSFGSEIRISYRALADAAVHDMAAQPAVAGAVAGYPKTWAVLRYQMDDGTGGTYTVKYHYRGGARGLLGRGFLGFAKQKVTDSRIGASVETQYYQAWPYTGMIKQKDLRDARGGLISRTTVDPAKKTWGSGDARRVFVYPGKRVEKSYRLDTGALLKTVTRAIHSVDDYGSPTESVRTVTGGGKTFTTLKKVAYDNDTTNWCLGQARRSETSTRIPGGQSQTRVIEAGYSDCLVRWKRQWANTAKPLTTSYGYDALGQVKQTTVDGPDVASRVSKVDYTADHRFVETATNSAGHVTEFSWYPALGLKKSVTDPNNLTTSFEYDAFGRLIGTDYPGALSRARRYEFCTAYGCGVTGGIYKITESQNTGAAKSSVAQSVTVYDALGREVLTGKAGLRGSWSYQYTNYNALGQAIAVSQPRQYEGKLGGQGIVPRQPASPGAALSDAGTQTGDIYWTLYRYDLLGRVTAVQHPYNPRSGAGGGQTRTDYDGFKTYVTNPLDQTTVKITNALGQTVATTDALHHTTRYGYDAAGHLNKTVDPAGNAITMGYARGNKIWMTDPDMGHWTYRYNAFGELIQQTDAKGQITTMRYDVLGRMFERIDGANSAAPVASHWDYDKA
ncbi:MAG TPA: toxin TcdB middle/N-terminal domain-containing protein, partial [Gammaproteobacteria bacterium]|nr:toxin TcdB middle/N-terminal domain-containing protein [Gammaproteobacteria bacterium]